MKTVPWILLPALLVLAFPSPGRAQKIWYEAARPDSFASYGMSPLVTDEGDTVLVDLYRSFAPVGDTSTTRRQALVSWAGLSAFVKKGNYHAAVIYYVWPRDSTTEISDENIVDTWGMAFFEDRQGCWHIVNDTTPVSTCVRRDDPRSPGAESPYPPVPE